MAQRVFYRIDDLTSTKEKKGRYPVSRATWWRWVREGKAPQPHKLGPNTTVWAEGPLDEWDAQKIAGVQ